MPEATLVVVALAFPAMDQLDLTGPFEVLTHPALNVRLFIAAKIPNQPITSHRGLRILPDVSFADVDAMPAVDVLLVPGGAGQQALMEDDPETLSFLARQATRARHVLCVCTGALIVGAAGLLRGRRATTHWTAFHLLPYFGAIPVPDRVVRDGSWTFAAGVTAGIDGALRLAADLRGEAVAQQIQLAIQYAPEPPFPGGDPGTAPYEALAKVRQTTKELTDARLETAIRIATRLGIEVSEG
ncbi:hypothetical protein HK405_009189 [Cladochytrium tenue]|nr:hypothetical protein HK405_009189 [Cladochytrium tenue]